MSRFGNIVVLCLIILSAGTVASGQNEEKKPSLAVRTFENPPFYYQSTIGTGLTDLFINELMRTGKYRLVEREGLDDLLDEVDLGQSDYSDRRSAVPKGRFIGPEYLLIGKVTAFAEKQKSLEASGFGGVIAGLGGLRKYEAYVRIDFRIVDSKTREVIYSGFCEGLDETGGYSAAASVPGGGGSIDVSSKSFLDSKLGRATLKALRTLSNKLDHSLLTYREAPPLSGRVLAVVDGQVAVINLGKKSGIVPGETLSVFRLENVTDSKGQIVYSNEVPIGSVKVSETQDDRSKGIRISGELMEGYIVRRD